MSLPRYWSDREPKGLASLENLVFRYNYRFIASLDCVCEDVCNFEQATEVRGRSVRM